jgi:hypothetical protein
LKGMLFVAYLSGMEIKALILHKDAFALYVITEECEGIYTASMRRYDGNPQLQPPPVITLTKGVRSWKGSSELQGLVDELGDVIEINIKSGMKFRSREDV